MARSLISFSDSFYRHRNRIESIEHLITTVSNFVFNDLWVISRSTVFVNIIGRHEIRNFKYIVNSSNIDVLSFTLSSQPKPLKWAIDSILFRHTSWQLVYNTAAQSSLLLQYLFYFVLFMPSAFCTNDQRCSKDCAIKILTRALLHTISSSRKQNVMPQTSVTNKTGSYSSVPTFCFHTPHCLTPLTFSINTLATTVASCCRDFHPLLFNKLQLFNLSFELSQLDVSVIFLARSIKHSCFYSLLLLPQSQNGITSHQNFPACCSRHYRLGIPFEEIMERCNLRRPVWLWLYEEL